MRKVKLQMQLSLDAYVSGPKGEMDWIDLNLDEAGISYINKITEPVDCIILGRVLAQSFINYWEATANKTDSNTFSRKMSDTPKVVFSKTLKVHDWSNTILANDVVEDINKLKNQEGGDIMVYGGGNLVSNLIKADLIDEFHFFINPVILGSGMPIFQGLLNRVKLTLVHSESFSSGKVALCYLPIRP